MKTERAGNPLIPYGWLRALLFLIVFVALSGVGALVLGTMLKSLQAGPENASSNLNYLVFLIIALIATAIVWLFRRFVDRQSFESLGFELKGQGRMIVIGTLLALFILCAGSAVLFFMKRLEWTDIHFSANDLFISLVLMLIVAFYEELVFRGYLLNNLLASLNKWIALVISALLFTLVHVANPGVTLLPIVNVFLAGLLLGLNYIFTRNLWFGMALHFAWNFIQGPLLGYPVSGLALQNLLQHDVNGNLLITGGAFGFEGSLVATAFLAVAIASLALVFHKKYSAPVFETVSRKEAK